MIPTAQPRGLKSARQVAKTAKVFALGRQYPAGELFYRYLPPPAQFWVRLVDG
jgi:hypothetical protein